MINLVVEGLSDTGAAKAIVLAAGREVGKVYVAGGKTRLDPKIANYHAAARHANWVVFRDSDSQCPVSLLAHLARGIKEVNPRFQLRIAHSMTEAWFLADRDGFADYFQVPKGKIKQDPESLKNAKQELLRLCQYSRSRNIRGDVLTKDGQVGPLYVARLNEFASEWWDVAAARECSRSLDGASRRVEEMPD